MTVAFYRTFLFFLSPQRGVVYNVPFYARLLVIQWDTWYRLDKVGALGFIRGFYFSATGVRILYIFFGYTLFQYCLKKQQVIPVIDPIGL
jgi:hypothetical protein